MRTPEVTSARQGEEAGRKAGGGRQEEEGREGRQRRRAGRGDREGRQGGEAAGRHSSFKTQLVIEKSDVTPAIMHS